MIVRRATENDGEGLQILYGKHLTQNPPQELQDLQKWQAFLRRVSKEEGYYLLVGEKEGVLVVSVTLIVIQNLTHNMRPYALVENVVTHEDYRNQGFASELMKEAEAITIENKCYKMMLMTGSKKESTLGFYERCGFSQNEKTAFLKWIS